LTERFSAAPASEGLRFLTIAELSARDFYQARQFSGFSGWANFGDFRIERDFLGLGYACAGVPALRQRVSFAAFEGWSRLTGAPVDLDGLDDFAAHWRYRAHRPAAPTRGRFGAPGQPERHAVEIDGAQIVVVRKDVYARWRDEFAARAPFPAPDLDAYATQVVACCLASPSRARRPAVKTARKSASEFDERR
jgi:hypothetical protein